MTVRRRFDWYGLTLPGILVAGLACLGIAALGNATGFLVVGWIFVGMAVLVAPVWIFLLVRTRTALRRVAFDPAEVRFIGSLLGDDGKVRGRDYVVTLADANGVRVVGGDPTQVHWSARWSEVGAPTRGSVRSGRTEFPTIAFDRAAGDTCVVSVIHPNGWPASLAYANDVQAELSRLWSRAR